MADATTEDELQDLEDDYKKKPIGKPIGPQQSGVPIGGGQTSPVGAPITTSTAMPSTPAPDVQAPSPYASVGQPINVAPPLTPKPEYHGLNRVLDTIAGATKIGSAIEAAGGLGTEGWRQKNADEEAQIEEGEKSRAANAAAENVGAEAQQKEAQAGLQSAQAANLGKTATVTANGVTYEVPISELGGVLKTDLTQQGASGRTAATNATRQSIANETLQNRSDIEHSREGNASSIAAGRNAAEIEAAQVRNTTPRAQIMYVPQPDGSYSAITVNPGTSVPAGTETAGGVNTMSTPTSQTRNMGQMAGSVLQQIPRIKDEIKSISDQLGPAAGRWNQVYANGIGADDPKFTGLDTDLDLLASAIVRTHFGARGGQAYQEALKKNFTEAQTPDDLISRIDHANEWLEGYAKMAGGTPGGTSTTTTPSSGGGFAAWKAKH